MMLRVLVKLAVVHSPNNSNIFTCNVISNVPKGKAFLGRMAQILMVGMIPTGENQRNFVAFFKNAYEFALITFWNKNSESSFLFDFNTLFETHYIMNEWIVPMILHKHV